MRHDNGSRGRSRAISAHLRGWLLPALALWSCGASNGTVTAGDEPKVGSVSVRNETGWDVEISWLQSGDDGDVVQRVLVAAGQERELAPEPFPALAELNLDLVLLVPPETGPRVRRKAKVVVNGDLVVLLRAGADPFSVEVGVTG